MTVQFVTTVDSAAPDLSLVSRDDFKAEIKLDLRDTSNDAWIDRAIGQVSRSISSYCNRVFPREKLTDTIFIQQDPYPYQTPGGLDVLQLSRWPVIALDSVKQRLSAATLQTLTAGTDFVLNAGSGELIRLEPNGLASRWEALPTSVQYDAGFDAIPDDVAVAALRWLVWRWNERTRDPALKATQQPDLGTRSYYNGARNIGGLPDEIATLLDSYRVPVVY